MLQQDLFFILNSLNIKHDSEKINHNGWIPIICPLHNDKDFGNAYVNINSGVINCFKCHQKIGLESLWKDRHKEDYKPKFKLDDTVEIINTKMFTPEKRIDRKGRYLFTNVLLNPDNYDYTKKRGFTKEFVEKFNIRHCLSEPYPDYFIIPIQDSKKGIDDFEARKLMEYEILKERYGYNSLVNLKQIFKKEKSEKKLKLTKNKLYENKEEIFDSKLKYLLTPKVKYDLNSRIKETLWNIDNLDRNEILYVVEGFGSIPKIYNNISKNVTCLFGSSITDYQIAYLREFKNVRIIPDPDEAGYRMVNKLRFYSNIKVIDVKSEDTDAKYVKDLQNPDILMDIKEYLYYNLYKYPFASKV